MYIERGNHVLSDTMLHYQEGNLRLSTTGSVEEQPAGRSPATMPETSSAVSMFYFSEML